MARPDVEANPICLSGASFTDPREGDDVPDIVLAHDYLLQIGGAERVVAHWAAGFDARTVVTLAHRPESTFEDFGRLDVRASLPSPFRGQVERMLPTLPSIAARTTVSGGDIALVSSSGWAHRFRFEMPTSSTCTALHAGCTRPTTTGCGSTCSGAPGSR